MRARRLLRGISSGQTRAISMCSALATPKKEITLSDLMLSFRSDGTTGGSGIEPRHNLVSSVGSSGSGSEKKKKKDKVPEKKGDKKSKVNVPASAPIRHKQSLINFSGRDVVVTAVPTDKALAKLEAEAEGGDSLGSESCGRRLSLSSLGGMESRSYSPSVRLHDPALRGRRCLSSNSLNSLAPRTPVVTDNGEETCSIDVSVEERLIMSRVATLFALPDAERPRVAVCATGGGGRLSGWFFGTPGASGTVLDMAYPYHHEALRSYLGESLFTDVADASYCSLEMARAMARAARIKAWAMHANAVGGDLAATAGTNIVGVGLTAALVTCSDRRGKDRVVVVLSCANGTEVCRKLTFIKKNLDADEDNELDEDGKVQARAQLRLEQDYLCGRLVVKAITDQFLGASPALKSDLIENATAQVLSKSLDHRAVVTDHVISASPQTQSPCISIDGSFNTLGDAELGTDIAGNNENLELSSNLGRGRHASTHSSDYGIGLEDTNGNINTSKHVQLNNRGSHVRFNQNKIILEEFVNSGQWPHVWFFPTSSRAGTELRFEQCYSLSTSTRELSHVVKFLILPGSFNPLHEGHEALAAAALDKVSDRHRAAGLKPVCVFEISISNVDKGQINIDQVSHRVSQFVDARAATSCSWPVVVTSAGSFLKKAQVMPGVTFVVGYDTAVRLIDPKYYDSEHNKMVAALLQLNKLGCDFIVGGRALKKGDSFMSFSDMMPDIPDGLQQLFTPLEESDFRLDISSSELREKAGAPW